MIFIFIYLELIKHRTVNYTIDHQYFRLYSSVFSMPLMGYKPPYQAQGKWIDLFNNNPNKWIKNGKSFVIHNLSPIFL
jgi:hypothetical protein